MSVAVKRNFAVDFFCRGNNFTSSKIKGISVSMRKKNSLPAGFKHIKNRNFQLNIIRLVGKNISNRIKVCIIVSFDNSNYRRNNSFDFSFINGI